MEVSKARTASLPSSRDWKIRNECPLSYWEATWLLPLLNSASLLCFPISLSRLTSSGNSQLTSPPDLGFAWPFSLSTATTIQPPFCVTLFTSSWLLSCQGVGLVSARSDISKSFKKHRLWCKIIKSPNLKRTTIKYLDHYWREQTK